MPAPQDDAADRFPVLQKQLILSQVQILELEDTRDELQAVVADRSKTIAELQTLADRAWQEAQQSRDAAASTEENLRLAHEANRQLQDRIASLRNESELALRQLRELEHALGRAKAAAAEYLARVQTLDAELRNVKTSRSWRWTAPLRSIARLFR